MNIKKIGLSSGTLIVCEEAGILCPERDENSYRSYSQADISRIFLSRVCVNLIYLS
ncbi:MAG TPA: MerR family transcriptional regulator [Lactovum miscens]|uniref:DNA-binding transcriptional MerR regulator n=1 Tax=Lactovum miscens TaxID=190387 RepID=A0A841C4Y1_9LACT|nr:DNA-binding transcriptional MerR regulator [Lactovum miscens]